jgi:hypothetical protein
VIEKGGYGAAGAGKLKWAEKLGREDTILPERFVIAVKLVEN